jgi:hypothetical protein
MIRISLRRAYSRLFWVLMAVLPLQAQQPLPKTIKIPDGTVVHLYLKDDLNSKKNKENDPVRFQVREDVKLDGIVVIPAGSWASGRVHKVDRRGFAGHSGKLAFSVDSVKAVDGTAIPLRGSARLVGGRNAAVTAAATAMYGPGALLMRGADTEIGKGTMLNAYADGDREVTLPGPPAAPPAGTPTSPSTAEQLLGLQPSSPPSPAPAPEDLSTVVFRSTPEGADVAVDGKYMCTTPSTVRLPAGNHTLSIQKPGFKPWKRTLMVIPRGNITIDATLEPNP